MNWLCEHESEETNLFQQPSLLYYVGNRFHLDAFRLINILESVEVACLFVLNDSDLYMRYDGADNDSQP